MSKEYAPLPFSYLTGGVAPENKSTGFKRSESNSNPEAADGVPYSIYSGRTLDQQDARKRAKVVSLDVADPYLLSTGALNGTDTTAADPTALFSSEPRNSFAEDPRYRDSIPSESDGGNVFFRSPDAKETHKSQTQPTTTGDSSAGYVNLAHDREDDVGPTKKLPRFVLSDKGVYQYYTGSENQLNDRRTGDDVQSNDVDKAENPIWDKYYATGGLHPGDYGDKKVTDGLSAGVRPTTNVGDFNTSLRARPSEKNHSSACCCCCTSKKSAVLCAVFITAIICLAVGFVCGWFIYQEYGSRLVGNGTSGLSSIATTLTSTTTTTTTQSPTTTTLTSFNNVTASTNQNMSITTET